MYECTEIKQYRYRIYASRPKMYPFADATVTFSDATGNTIGNAVFLDDSETLKESANTNGQVTLYYRISLLPHVIDMLRNEKPVFLLWAGAQNSCITTSEEPVGEEESS